MNREGEQLNDEWRAANPLRAWRRKTGTTARTVAERLGVSGISVMLWEKGAKTPRPENLKAIGRLIGAPDIYRRWTRWQADDPREGAA